jgi:dipeptidyl aminopeptidase/acylaminoacyl peptidase
MDRQSKWVWACCAMAACWSFAALSAEQPTMATGEMLNRQSCYQGEYAGAERLAAAIEQGGRVMSEAARRGLREDYRALREAVECEWYDYIVDGYTVRGFYARPIHSDGTKLPVVIFAHGGNADIGAMRFRYIVGKLVPLVKQGYVVVGSQYRGASLDGKPSPDRLADEFGGRDVNDILALLPIIDTLPGTDRSRIGLWGLSRGGMMAFLAARRSHRFGALVAESTPTDMAYELAARPEMEQVFATWVPDFESQRDQALARRSAVLWADELDASMPILILHGADDRRVTVHSPLVMAERLQATRHPYKLVIFDGAGHGLRQAEDEANREIFSWFDRHLKQAAP